jgi:hypothetical protein
MIRYTLRCAEGHRFDSWFASGAECDRLGGAGLLSCAVCGSASVEKDLMAPNVGSGGTAREPAPDDAGARPLSAPASPAEQALRALRARIEAVSENVGQGFATEARRIHEGIAPARPIIGEAKPAEARALIEDGVPIAPLPWTARRTQ